MQEIMLMPTYQKAILLFLIILVIVLIFRQIMVSIAYKYLENNKSELFNKNYNLCSRIKSNEANVKNNYNQFKNYVDILNLDGEYDCSASVVSGAAKDPVKYLIKYANIEYNKESLEKIDFCLNFTNAYCTLTNDIFLLANELRKQVPTSVKLFVRKIDLPYNICDLDKAYTRISLPQFAFSYVSPKGKSSSFHSVISDVSVLTGIRNELNLKLTKKGHAKLQRGMMTNDLREAIKKRDNYTCKICGNSVYQEPNLLLEVDHIIPVAKGGKTEAGNLQTLCWRCNRQKSDN